ncbi:hypothetical protein HD554DRAFT_1010106 [Boletus coccyginus]|nr:hypothetical protein HD554DRAFT_1010106 [Boletus coccyginus]
MLMTLKYPQNRPIVYAYNIIRLWWMQWLLFALTSANSSTTLSTFPFPSFALYLALDTPPIPSNADNFIYSIQHHFHLIFVPINRRLLFILELEIHCQHFRFRSAGENRGMRMGSMVVEQNLRLRLNPSLSHSWSSLIHSRISPRERYRSQGSTRGRWLWRSRSGRRGYRRLSGLGLTGR